MKRFAEFSEEDAPLDGDKVKLEDILDQEVAVLNFRKGLSKFTEHGEKSYTAIQIEKEERRMVLFTGSGVLARQLEKYADHLPFLATIRKIDRYYSMT